MICLLIYINHVCLYLKKQHSAIDGHGSFFIKVVNWFKDNRHIRNGYIGVK